MPARLLLLATLALLIAAFAAPTADAAICFGKNHTAEGGNGDDFFTGGFFDDVVVGNGGDDEIGVSTFFGGNDANCGNDGADRMRTGDGTDRQSGGAGNDFITDLAGNDQLLGGTGDDILDEGAGRGDLQGGAGSDQLLGKGDDDVLQGDSSSVTSDSSPPAGNDNLRGDIGDDTLRGGDGADILDGGANSDVIFARDITTPAQLDTIRCGTGIDRVDMDLRDAGISASQGSAQDAVTAAGKYPDCEDITVGAVKETRNVAIAVRLTVRANGVVAARLSCPASARLGCRGTLAAGIGTRSAGKPTRYRLRRGRRDTVGARLSRADRRALARGRRRARVLSVEKGVLGPKVTVRTAALRLRR